MDKIIYEKDLIPKVFIKLYSDIECPFCAICRKVLHELDDIYESYITFIEDFSGKYKPPIQEGTLFSLRYVGYNPIAHSIIKNVYDQKTPRTIINNLYVFEGTDSFKNNLKSMLTKETLKDVKNILPGVEIKKISEGYYDGLDYENMMNNLIVNHTGIKNERFIKLINHKLNEREKVISFIFENLQRKIEFYYRKHCKFCKPYYQKLKKYSDFYEINIIPIETEEGLAPRIKIKGKEFIGIKQDEEIIKILQEKFT